MALRHLDEFPYVEYVHRGDTCTKGVDGKLEFHDPGLNAGSAISLYCSCGAKRTMRNALKHHRDPYKEIPPVFLGRNPAPMMTTGPGTATCSSTP